MTLVWQHGVGTELLFGIGRDRAVPSWAPVIVFAFIYGLSMDYEVFILARMREEYDRTGSTDRRWCAGWAHRAARDQRGADRLPRVRLDGDRARTQS